MAQSAKLEKRVQFDVLPERLSEIDQLMVYCDLRTRRDLFDHAMSLFEWAVHEVRDGREIASYDKKTDTVKALKIPALDNAARRTAASRPFGIAERVDADGSDEVKSRRDLTKLSAVG